MASNYILDLLKDFGLYQFGLRMGTEPVWSALTIHGCYEIGCMLIALRERFASYYFDSGEVSDLEDEVVPAGSLARGVRGISISVIFWLLCRGEPKQGIASFL